MRLLDRYVFVEWLKVFAIALGVTLGILIMHDMYSNLGKLINWGASLREISLFYVLLAPTLIPVVLPISLLISLIYVLGALHRNNEITAMRSAGMNVFSITRTLWLAGLALSGLMLWLNADAIPVCIERSRAIYDSVNFEQQLKSAKDAGAVGVLAPLCFNDRKQGRLWFMNSFSQATNEGRGVSVSVMDADGAEKSKVMASKAVYDDAAGCWEFYNGKFMEFAEGGTIAHESSFDRRRFEDFNEEPRIMALSMRRAKDLSLFETKALLDSFGGESARESLPYLVRWYSIWTSSFVCLIVVAIAIPFSVSGVRTNPMVGVSKTFGLFFLYYIIDNIMAAMGGRGIISPLAASVIPVVAMFAFALSLYRKAT